MGLEGFRTTMPVVSLVDTTVPDLRSHINRQALAYWNDKRGSAPMPRKIDLIEITPFIQNVLIVDVLADPRDFYYRFVGSRIDEFLSTPLTGRNMLDLPRQRPPSRIWAAFCKTVDQRAPVSGDVPYIGPQPDFISVEDLIMPVAADGETVSSLFITADFFRPSRRRA
jgi:hypothetical protein